MYTSIPVCSVVAIESNEVQAGRTIQRLLLRYPAAGQRNDIAGNLGNVNQYTICFSVTRQSSGAVWSMRVGDGWVQIPAPWNTSAALSVRCVSVFWQLCFI